MRKNNKNLFVIYEFGKRVAYLRNLQGISQEELAFRCGMQKTYLGEIETGKRNPTLYNIERISIGLEVPLEILFLGIGEIKNRRR